MSLPHSFFTRIQTGGEFSFIREWVDSNYSWYLINSFSKNIKYHPQSDTVFWMAQQNYGGLATASFYGVNPMDGSWTEHGMFQMASVGVEPRGFDLWADGSMVITHEAGGSSYVQYTNTTRTAKVNNAAVLYNGGSGNGYVYIRNVQAYDTPTYGKYFVTMGNFGTGPAWYDYAPYGATSINYNQKRVATAQSVLPVGLALQNVSAAAPDDYHPYVVGRMYDGGFWKNYYFNTAAGWFSPQYHANQDVGYSNDHILWDVDTWGGKTYTDNPDRIHFAGGTVSNASIPFLQKMASTGFVANTRIVRSSDLGNGNANIHGVHWDSVNNRLYVTGSFYCPNTSDPRGYGVGNSTDGFVACFTSPKDTTSGFTMEWIVGVQPAGSYQSTAPINIVGVTSDTTGQPIILGCYNNANYATGAAFVMKLPSDGSVSGTYGNYKFYDMAPYVTLLGNTNGTLTGLSDTGGSWSTTTNGNGSVGTSPITTQTSTLTSI